jgi:hypothetical protein
MLSTVLIDKNGAEVASVEAPEGTGAIGYGGKLYVDDLSGRYVETSYFFADDAALERREIDAAEKVIEDMGNSPP